MDIGEIKKLVDGNPDVLITASDRGYFLLDLILYYGA